jgi:NAD(P)-dependent dehydrogenase (short-subunit alcohol dehydrogenase family)
MSTLTEKVALVTGGSRGIGAAIAKRLAKDGASVAITYAKDANAASAVVKAIERDGGKALAIHADAADVAAVRSAVEKAVATFGRLDVLVNNAGTAIPKPFEEATQEEMDRVVDINIRGVFATAGCAEAHEGWRPHHHDRFGGGRARGCTWACALRGHERSRQDVHSGAFQRGREPGHHGQQRPAGSDRHGFKSRLG